MVMAGIYEMVGKAGESGETGSRSSVCVSCCASWTSSWRLVTVYFNSIALTVHS